MTKAQKMTRFSLFFFILILLTQCSESEFSGNVKQSYQKSDNSSILNPESAKIIENSSSIDPQATTTQEFVTEPNLEPNSPIDESTITKIMRN